MARVLVVYGTTQGQTRKIAKRIQSELMQMGSTVDLFECTEAPHLIGAHNYKAVVIGGSVHVGGYQKQLKQWVKANSKEINNLPSAFFTVCLGVLQGDAKVQAEIKQITTDFQKVTAWSPSVEAVFAGSLAYSKYNFAVRWWMKRIAKKSGGDTDTSKDYEYTDWSEVSRFVNDFSKQMNNNIGFRRNLPLNNGSDIHSLF
jgi:menaquinone-dependent protoporphyrinogen oxidase